MRLTGTRPASLRVESDGSVHLDLEGQETESRRSFLSGDVLALAFPTNVETTDTARAPKVILNLMLRQRDGRLCGQAIAREHLESERMRFALSHWIDLKPAS